MMKKRVISVLTAFAMLFTFAAASFAENGESEKKEYSAYFIKNMIKAYAHNIANNYYYGISDNDLLFSVICDMVDNDGCDPDSAVRAMIECLGDEHAEFYSPEEFAAMQENVSGEFSGIGVTITVNDTGIVVLSVIKDSPAEKAGIIDGDYIISVEGTSTEGMTASDVRNLIVGEIGTNVNLCVRRSGKDINIVCVRDNVTLSQIETKTLPGDIAYLRLVQFTKGAADEIAAYAEELKQNKTKKLILDLRNNPGGDLDAALAIANTFISSGKLGQLKYRDETKNKFLYSNNHQTPKLKIAVLVNENSASASEFLSMAFQGRKAGKIIGTQTYGKGSMQVLSQIATGAGMKFTVGEFYTIDNKRVNTIGITPDIYVENEYERIDEASFEPVNFNHVADAKNDEKMTLALEQRLNALGLFDEAPDGVYDESTIESVRRLQNILGYEANGTAGFYEYLYLNDTSYDFDKVVDKQLDEAINYLNN